MRFIFFRLSRIQMMLHLLRLERSALLSLLLTLIAFGAAASPALAQPQAVRAPLADRVPAEALLYIGWAGTERVAELYDGTHTQALVRQSNFEDLFTRYVPELLDRLAQEEPEAAEAIQVAREMLPLFIKRPSAMVFGGVNLQAGAPMPRLLFAVDAGEEANALEQRVRRL